MSCGLKRALGVEAPCESGACVFWRHADAESGMPQGCVLTHYRLTGCEADQTTRWLYDYKLSADRARIAAIMHEMRPMHVINAREPVAAGGWSRIA